MWGWVCDVALYMAVFAVSLAVGRRVSVDLSAPLGFAAVAVVFTVGLWGGAVLGVEGLGAVVAVALVYALLAGAACMVVGLVLGGGRAGCGGRPGVRGGAVLFGLVLGLGVGLAVGRVVPVWLVELAVRVEVVAIIVLAGLEGAGGVSWGSVRRSGGLVLRSVVAAVVGGGVAGLLGSLVTGMGVGASLMFTWGMGWYSLAGPYAAARFGAGVGLAVFLANMVREQLTYLLVPLVGRPYVGLLCLGGATTMDNTLPAFVSVYGEEAAVDSLVNGAVMTVLAPLLLSLAALLG